MEHNAPAAESGSRSAITRSDVEHAAALASLALTEDELDRLSRDLSAILGYVAELQGVDTAAVAPLTHVSELWGEDPARFQLRGDEPAPSLARPRIMEGAPATDGVFFKVPRVIER